MSKLRFLLRMSLAVVFFGFLVWPPIFGQQAESSPIKFELKSLPFRLDSDESVTARNVPETMAGGVAVFDYNGDGRPDIFFANGADLQTLKKTSDKFSDRLYRNDGDGVFTDVTALAGLQGHGFDNGVAAGDYDNDGHPDIFVMGVHGNTLYHNNGDGTFSDVTKKAGLDKSIDPEFGPLYGVAAAWIDVNNDGLLDLFVVNYLQWAWSDKPLCTINNIAEYCHPRYYKGLPDQLFLNQGDGTFKDVSKEWGIRDHIGKGMGVGVADFDLDGRPDLFVTNDAGYSFLFHNLGNKFEEIAFQAGIALPEEGAFISGMGLDFRDFDNDGYPDVAYVALNRQTFPLFRNTGKGDFTEVTASSSITSQSLGMSGFGPALYDFDNDGWKDLFVARANVMDNIQQAIPAQAYPEPNSVFRNLGNGKFQDVSSSAGPSFQIAGAHRGAAFGDIFNSGRIDAVVTGLNEPVKLFRNVGAARQHWILIRLVGTRSNRMGLGAQIRIITPDGRSQWNEATTAVGYACSSDPRVHFGLGHNTTIKEIRVTWPSRSVQSLANVAADQILTIEEPKS
jgi:enediyne biosynthesis protein E4